MSQAALSDPLVLRSLVACASVLALSPSRYVAFGKEVIGSALTVVLVVGSGPLVGVLLGNAAAPYVGEYEGAMIMCSSIVLIDRLFGGPKNNPIVSLVLYMWGLSRPLDVLVEISGQLAGGLIGFPILASVCATHGKSMGRPSVDLASTAFSKALISEAGLSTAGCSEFVVCIHDRHLIFATSASSAYRPARRSPVTKRDQATHHCD